MVERYSVKNTAMYSLMYEPGTGSSYGIEPGSCKNYYSLQTAQLLDLAVIIFI